MVGRGFSDYVARICPAGDAKILRFTHVRGHFRSARHDGTGRRSITIRLMLRRSKEDAPWPSRRASRPPGNRDFHCRRLPVTVANDNGANRVPSSFDQMPRDIVVRRKPANEIAHVATICFFTRFLHLISPVLGGPPTAGNPRPRNSKRGTRHRDSTKLVPSVWKRRASRVVTYGTDECFKRLKTVAFGSILSGSPYTSASKL